MPDGSRRPASGRHRKARVGLSDAASKLGATAFAALSGLIIATVVNLFLASETIYWGSPPNLFILLLRIFGQRR